MKLSLPLKPAEIPSASWDMFLEKYYIPYLQANYTRISREGISNKDVIYLTEILDKLEENYYSLSGLGQWGALIGGIISAIPSVVSGIAQYKLGKSQIKLQKEEIEARKQREAAEAEAARKQQEAVISAKSVSTTSRAIEAVSEYSPYLMIMGGLFLGSILLYKLLKRR
jgi:hypothetical protein